MLLIKMVGKVGCRRGQAAMEFLMTYGWAILAAIIAIGVLAYFGVFSPGKYAPTATVLNVPFYASGSVLDGTNSKVQMEIKNNGGDDIYITNVSIIASGSSTGNCVNQTLTPLIQAGTSYVLTSSCAGVVGNKIYKGDVKITYFKSGSSMNLTSSGSMTEKAQ